MSTPFKCLVLFVLFQSLVFVQGHTDHKVLHQEAEELTKEDFESEKIAGGVGTTIDKFPFQVGIKVANLTVCGGAILSTAWILTAAHCVGGAIPSLVAVQAGSTTFGTGGTTFTALNIVVHSLYNASKNNDYDFALVQINGTLTFGTTIKSIPIPVQNKAVPFLGNIAVSGWGLTSEGSTPQQTLRTVNVRIIPLKICRLLYAGTATITDRMFCAGKLIFGRGSCQGDVGGAAVYQNTAIGIASFGISCGNPVFPSVFANVASVTEWIKGITGI